MKRNEEQATTTKIKDSLGRELTTLSTPTGKQNLPPFSGEQMDMLGLSQKEVDAYWEQERRKSSAIGRLMDESGSLQQRKTSAVTAPAESGKAQKEEEEKEKENREHMDMVFQSSRWTQQQQQQQQAQIPAAQSQLLTPMMGMMSTPSPSSHALSSPLTTAITSSSAYSRQGTSPVSSPSLQGMLQSRHAQMSLLK